MDESLSASLQSSLDSIIKLDACQRLLHVIRYRGVSQRKPSSSMKKSTSIVDKVSAELSAVAAEIESSHKSLARIVASGKAMLPMELRALNDECKKLVQGGLLGRERLIGIQDENERFLILAEHTMRFIRDRLFRPAKSAHQLLTLLAELENTDPSTVLQTERRLLEALKKTMIYAVDAVRDNALDKITNASPEQQARRRKLNREIDVMRAVCEQSS